MNGVGKLCAGLLYGSGLRLLEGLRLRVKDLDFGGTAGDRSGRERQQRPHHPAARIATGAPCVRMWTRFVPSISGTSPAATRVVSSCHMPPPQWSTPTSCAAARWVFKVRSTALR